MGYFGCQSNNAADAPTQKQKRAGAWGHKPNPDAGPVKAFNATLPPRSYVTATNGWAATAVSFKLEASVSVTEETVAIRLEAPSGKVAGSVKATL